MKAGLISALWWNFCVKILTTPLTFPRTGRGGPSRSWVAAVGGSAPPQPTLPPAPPARVTPATTGCFFRCAETTTSRTAACTSTTRPRASSTPSQSSSRRHPKAGKHATRLWITPSSAAFERKLAAKGRATTGAVRICFSLVFSRTTTENYKTSLWESLNIKNYNSVGQKHFNSKKIYIFCLLLTVYKLCARVRLLICFNLT